MASSLMCILNGRAYKNINLKMFKMLILFHIPNFFYSIERFYKIIQPWCYSAKNRLLKAGKDWILPTNKLQIMVAKIKTYITSLKTFAHDMINIYY